MTDLSKEQSETNKKEAGFQLREFSEELSAMLPFLLIVLAAIEGIGKLWRPLGGLLYLSILGFSTFLIFGKALFRDYKSIESGKEEREVTKVIIYTLLLVVSFSQICRYFFLWFGGFLAEQTTYWYWIRFGLDSLIEALLLDIPEIYGWNLTQVKPTMFWSQSALFLFRALIELIVVSQLIQTVQFAKSKWKPSTKTLVKVVIYNGYFHFMNYQIDRHIDEYWYLWGWALPFSIVFGIASHKNITWDSLLNAIIVFCTITSILIGLLSFKASRHFKDKINKSLAILGMIVSIYGLFYGLSELASILGLLK